MKSEGAKPPLRITLERIAGYEKARVSVDGLHTRVDLEKTRNERGRLRVGSLRVEISVDVPNELRDRFERCRSIFEDYCTITESVRHGVPVEVELTTSSATPGANR